MFMNNNVMKKLVIAVASIALVIPLASVPNVSAKRINHYHTVRVTKHVHYYYKGVYDKHEYNEYKSMYRANNQHISKVAKKLHINKHNALFRKGFFNGMNNYYIRHLVNKKQYKNGLVIGYTYSSDNKVTKKAVKYNLKHYKSMLNNGFATGSVKNQLKNRAKINML